MCTLRRNMGVYEKEYGCTSELDVNRRKQNIYTKDE